MKGSDIVKKNTMIKILSLLAVVLSMTACSNTEAPDSSSTTTTVTTTTVNTTTAPVVTPSEISSTSLSESVPVVSDETTITTTEQEVNTSTSTEKINGSTSTETTPTSTTTTKKPPTTVTTTTKATTTTKKTTTTANTTTKKTTTTANTTTKVTTTTVQKANLTQADINKLVKELQEYSDNIVKESVLAKIEALKDKLPEGYNWETYLEEQYAKTPYDSSWSAPSSFDIYDDFYTYEYMLSYLKEAIDNEYENMPNCHVVVYAEYFPNGFIWEGVQYTSYPCYTFFELR